VLGWVHHDDETQLPHEVVALGERRQIDSVGARVALPVAVGGDDVVESGRA
jgi:hypothetical protein